MLTRSRLEVYLTIALLLIATLFINCQSPTNNTQQSNAVVGNEQLITLSDLGEVAEFSLTNQSGKTITTTDLKGKIWVADFFFTSCQGVCPVMTARMSKLDKTLGNKGLHLLSISVDPATDTPEKLTEYAKNFEAKDNWQFLTGEKAKIIDLSVKGFRLSLGEDPMSHSQRLVLIDGRSHIRGYYHVDRENEMQLIVEHATQLLKEANVTSRN
ncbi:MAG: SCO family protein [Blastocatellia bacterium]